MLQNLNNISFLIGKQEYLDNCKSLPALKVFSDIVVEFLADLSAGLLKDINAKKYSDVIAFAFWIRKSSIKNVAGIYQQENRIGRGMAFHIAPANIPVQFAVSLVYALVAGNASVIRISDKEFEQVSIICDRINNLVSNRFRDLAPYINIIRYRHDDEITSQISSLCDSRIIWGGDNTIGLISKLPMPSRSVELKFADRFSMMLIDADKYLDLDAKVIANDFYMDTFLVDQNACSSPRIVIWIGDKVDQAKRVFWDSIKKIVDERYEYNDISGSDKLLKFSLLAAKDKDIRYEKIDNSLVRVEVQKLYPELLEYKGNSGYFFEYVADSIDEIVSMLTKECQTIICCGIDKDEVKQLIVNTGAFGGDRVVDVGHALDLSFVWDGYDMIRELSRIVI